MLSADAQARARTDDKKVVAFFTAHEKVSAASQLQPFVRAGSMDRRLVAGADAGLHQLHEQAEKLIEQLPANIIEYVVVRDMSWCTACLHCFSMQVCTHVHICSASAGPP